MKITHLCLACFFPDGYSYQENLLPKFHKRLGYEVEVIASLLTFGSNGEQAYMNHCDTYINENGIKVVRLDYRLDNKVSKKLQLFRGLYAALENSEPDILFIHGCQFLDIKQVVKYLKNNPGIEVYVDNHADYSNSATNLISKYILHRIIWRHCAQLIEPFTTKFWGVLPARVDFLTENYGLPSEKCSLLVMGADDDEVARASGAASIMATRNRLDLQTKDFVIVTGGKFDESKCQILALMDAVAEIGGNVKLLIFGPVASSLKVAFDKRLQEDRIIYLPWASTSESYDYFAIADLIVFPGRHSVYWEQAAAMGKPLLVKRWAGTTHIDCGGNVAYTSGDDAVALANDLASLMEIEMLESMKRNADRAKVVFLYSGIAKRSIGIGS